MHKNNNMDVLMIGHSGAGKTSFMAGLYRTFGECDEKFGISTVRAADKEQLQAISNNLTHGRYPASTDISEEYEMWLKYDARKIIPFNWFDYRGGALLEKSRTSEESRNLIDRIRKADALIVFIDGAKIANYNSNTKEYDKMIWLITAAIADRYKNSDYPLPISFVITKGDKFIAKNQIYDTAGYKYFDNIRFSISKSSTSMGMETICSITPNDSINVFPPLLFSLLFGMDSYIESEEKRLDLWRKKLEDEEAKLLPLWHEDGFREIDEFVTGFLNIFRDKPHKTDYEKSIPIKKNIENQKKEINRIEKKLSFLASKKEEMKTTLLKMIKNGEVKYLNETSNSLL